MWLVHIKDKQLGDKSFELRFHQIEARTATDFGIDSDGILHFRGRICVPNDEDLRLSILREAYSSSYAMHPGGNKMYKDLRELYWWLGLKHEVTDFVACCLTCQQVKAEHKLPSGLLQPVKIPIWKWERLTKLYISEIVSLHGVLVLIIFDRDPRFTSRFWQKLHEAFGSYLNFSTAFYPQTNGQSERWKKVLRFGRKGKLSPRFIGEYRILKRVGPVAYQLELPLELARIYDVFRISMLRRYRSDPTNIVSVKEIEIRLDLTFEEEPIQILDRDVKVLRRKSIHLVKVLWRNHSTERLLGSQMILYVSSILTFSDQIKFEDEFSLRG
ncbi:uncharacterized protein [Gossypium hirsutum]|uniref:Integrase n=1 Tax=Gossypium hirsutum TaxID=3635 RepID=A0A1U8P6E9_GOSHI|nr:uncharacterized protein LOC107955392 [Gossypium hirsutum]